MKFTALFSVLALIAILGASTASSNLSYNGVASVQTKKDVFDFAFSLSLTASSGSLDSDRVTLTVDELSLTSTTEGQELTTSFSNGMALFSDPASADRLVYCEKAKSNPFVSVSTLELERIVAMKPSERLSAVLAGEEVSAFRFRINEATFVLYLDDSSSPVAIEGRNIFVTFSLSSDTRVLGNVAELVNDCTAMLNSGVPSAKRLIKRVFSNDEIVTEGHPKFEAAPTPAARPAPESSPKKGKRDGHLLQEIVRTFTFKPVHQDSARLSCEASSIGDGYCDLGCNTLEHSFDGGDCCKGTCMDSLYPCGISGFHCSGNIALSQPKNQNGLQTEGLTAGTKTCLFLHGAGRVGARPTVFRLGNVSPSTSFSSAYWGDFEDELEGLCTKFVYSDADTTNYTWDDKELMNSYYNRALKAYRDENGIVFAHSMGNMILGGACLRLGLCDVRFYMSQGPMRGTAAADTLKALSDIFGNTLAGSRKGLVSTYDGLKYATTNQEKLAYTVFSKGLLKGALCGYSGWVSIYLYFYCFTFFF